MTAFADAVTALVTARANHLASCHSVAAAETTHGIGSDEAHDAIPDPQQVACDAEMDAEERLALTPATTAQEAFQKAYLLMDTAIPDRSIKAVKADLGRFVDALNKADA